MLKRELQTSASENNELQSPEVAASPKSTPPARLIKFLTALGVAACIGDENPSFQENDLAKKETTTAAEKAKNSWNTVEILKIGEAIDPCFKAFNEQELLQPPYEDRFLKGIIQNGQLYLFAYDISKSDTDRSLSPTNFNFQTIQEPINIFVNSQTTLTVNPDPNEPVQTVDISPYKGKSRYLSVTLPSGERIPVIDNDKLGDKIEQKERKAQVVKDLTSYLSPNPLFKEDEIVDFDVFIDKLAKNNRFTLDATFLSKLYAYAYEVEVTLEELVSNINNYLEVQKRRQADL